MKNTLKKIRHLKRINNQTLTKGLTNYSFLKTQGLTYKIIYKKKAQGLNHNLLNSILLYVALFIFFSLERRL